MKAILDTTDRGLDASVLVRLAGRTYTLTIRAEGGGVVEIDATTEGLGVVVGAILEQLDDELFAALVATQVGHRMARELGQALIDVAASREAAARTRLGGASGVTER